MGKLNHCFGTRGLHMHLHRRLELPQPLGALDAGVQRLLHAIPVPEPQVLKLAGVSPHPDPLPCHPAHSR